MRLARMSEDGTTVLCIDVFPDTINVMVEPEVYAQAAVPGRPAVEARAAIVAIEAVAPRPPSDEEPEGFAGQVAAPEQPASEAQPEIPEVPAVEAKPAVFADRPATVADWVGGDPTWQAQFREVGEEVEPGWTVTRKGKKDTWSPPAPVVSPPRNLDLPAYKLLVAADGLGQGAALDAAIANARLKDRLYANREPTWPELNPKIGRILTAAKIDAKALFDAAALL